MAPSSAGAGYEVAEATLDHSAGAVPMPDTGSLATDLRALARSVAANIGSPTGGRMARTMVVAAATSDEVAAQAPDFWSTRLGLAHGIIERAVARRELHGKADANVIIESLIGPLYVRLLLTGERITRTFADQVADLVATGATAKYPGRSKRR